MSVYSNRLKIEELKLDDVYQMNNWGRHGSLLFKDYNFPNMNDKQIFDWYKFKVKNKNKKSYSIKLTSGKLIGYLTIREIKRFRKISTLGLVLDPNYMNNGYGTESLIIFLNYYFQNLKMKKMILQVAKFNKRAIRCYEKCGFRLLTEYYDCMDIQDIDLYRELPKEQVTDNFKVRNGIKYMGFYKMEIAYKEYKKRTKDISQNVYNFVDMWKRFKASPQYIDNNNLKNT
ncbi:GNAT family N-acetyltransferase [Senegalia massiliensis]|uniref:N-acetyltransferase n=1 Tax=Senegalia massiliensis TaxID=1720316 RepID=A0A845QX39_9CLOT|nr:GNAT family N-acetyltransferase [Senegalia massiliensis]NBI06554.1 N-acetyltransferase [Senegalia massiliensis]